MRRTCTVAGSGQGAWLRIPDARGTGAREHHGAEPREVAPRTDLAFIWESDTVGHNPKVAEVVVRNLEASPVLHPAGDGDGARGHAAEVPDAPSALEDLRLEREVQNLWPPVQNREVRLRRSVKNLWLEDLCRSRRRWPAS